MLSRLFLEGLAAAFEARELQFFADLAHLNEAKAFAATLVALRRTEWVVYAKKTFAGPKQLLAYLARYTHRVAITNNRLLDLDETHVRLAAPDYESGGTNYLWRSVRFVMAKRVTATGRVGWA